MSDSLYRHSSSSAPKPLDESLAAGEETESIQPSIRPTSHLDEPILADFLAMGGRRTGAAASVPKPLSPEPASKENLTAEKSERADSEAADHRERRIVAAALEPAVVLPQASSSIRPSRPQISSRSLRPVPRVLPLLFSQTAPSVEQPMSKSDQASRGQLVAETRITPSDASQTSIAAKPPKRTPHSLREKLCRAMLASFTEVTATTLGCNAKIVWSKLLLSSERDGALSQCVKGEIILLARHLEIIELLMKYGVQRRKFLETGMRDRNGESLEDEKKRLTQLGSIGVSLSSDDAIVALYLDRQLSWPRVRELLSRNARSRMDATAAKDQPE